MKQNPARWFEIYVQDMGRARKFYETVLDYKLEKLESEEVEIWTFPADKNGFGCGGALVKMPGFHSEGNGTIIYFASEDCLTEEKRVTAAGGKIEKPKMSIGAYGFISLLCDTEGNIFGLHSMT